MQTKSFVIAAAIALIAGVSSVSADEFSVNKTAGAPFAMLNGTATEKMSVEDLAATRGSASMLLPAIQHAREASNDSTTSFGTTTLTFTITNVD